MPSRLIGLLFLSICIALIAPPGALESSDRKQAGAAGNWPCWRGPQQNGYSPDTRVPLSWSATQNLKWKVDLPGFGNSSPIIWGDRIFLTSATRDGGERLVLCLDLATGKTLWQKTAARGLAPEAIHEWNTHASATCVTDGERVYAFFGAPGLFCYDFAGKLLWKQSLGKLACSTGWGIGAASPVLFEELVIVNGDQGGEGKQTDQDRRSKKQVDYGPSYLWAFNKRGGEVVWKTERNQGMSWGTPVFVKKAQGRMEMVLNSPHGVWAYEPPTGKELWHVTGRAADQLFGEVSPVWGHGLLVAFTGRPGPVLAIRLESENNTAERQVAWSGNRGGRDVSSPIIVGDQLFAVDRKGIATCYELKTGKELWRQRLGGEPCASWIFVRDRLLLLSSDGTTHVLEPGPAFKQVGTNTLDATPGEAFRASPAIVDGHLLIRSDRRLYCIAEASRP